MKDEVMRWRQRLATLQNLHDRTPVHSANADHPWNQQCGFTAGEKLNIYSKRSAIPLGDKCSGTSSRDADLIVGHPERNTEAIRR